MTTSADVRAKHAEFLFPCVANFYEQPIVLTSAKGSVATDLDGKEYLDFFGGILTIGLGHCQPEVVEAIQRQVATLGHTSTLYQTEKMVKVAETMARLTPGKLKQTFFTSSGTEADETAVMLAKMHTGRQEVIALRHGYSGRSHLAVSLHGVSSYRGVPSPIAGVVHAPSPYCYRCPFGQKPDSCGMECARDIEDVIRTTTTGQPAAFIAEPIQGVGGFITPPKDYFQVAVGIVRKYGGLFICDEVQTGFGRTGGKWWGIEHSGVEPDIMTFAKAMASGMPIGATTTTKEIAASWKGATIATFGGNSVSMAACEATLGVMEREDVPARSARLGKVLRDRLEGLKETFAFIGDVRGMGLMQALELVEDRKTKEPSPKKTAALLEAARRHGLLLGKGGLYGNAIRIAPPMLISDVEMDEALARLERAMSEVR